MSAQMRKQRNPLMVWIIGSFAVLVIVAGSTLLLASREKASTTKSSSFDPLSPFTYLETTLPNYLVQPIIGPFSRLVLDKIPEYKNLIKQASAHSKDLQIDFVWQTHLARGAGERELAMIAKSQRSVYLLLEQEQYDIIGSESSATEFVSIESMVEEQLANQRISPSDPTIEILSAEEIRASIVEKIPFDGILQYLQAHPNARIAGNEEVSLWGLHGTALNFVAGAYQVSPRWQQEIGKLAPAAREARSFLCVAKMIERMHKEGKKRAVIVLGYWHKGELEYLSRAWGLRSKFHDCK